MIHWFGKNWARFCEPANEVPVPQGRVCCWCDEPIEPGQDGGTLPELRADGTSGYAIFHCECMVRSFLGSAGHMRRECSCYNVEDVSEVGLTQREAAINAWRCFQAQRAQRMSLN